LRDDDSAFMLAKTMNFSLIYPVEVGEAFGLFHALQWLQDMQLNSVDFVVDSKLTSIFQLQYE